MSFSIWYKFWTFKNSIFSSHFYSGVCWLLSPTFDSLFSTSEHLYFLLSPSFPNPILRIFVGAWATENTLGTDNCVDLSTWVPPFSPPAHPYLLPPSCILHVTLWTSLVVPHGESLFTINLEVLLSVLYSWRSLETIGRIKLKSRSRRLKPKTWENRKTPDYTEHQGIRDHIKASIPTPKPTTTQEPIS